MLTYKTTRISFFLSFVTLAVLYEFNLINWYFLLIPVFLYIGLISYGSSIISSNFYLNSICFIPTSEKVFYLTFDDGPDSNTEEILALLNKNNIKATFFVIGKKITKNEMILNRMKEEGHIIANHSFSHSYFFDFFSTKKVIADLEQTNILIKKITGLTPRLFRPPYGVTNPNIANALTKLGLASIGWNIRSLDTVIKDKEKLNKRILKRIKPGSILLLHDTGNNVIEILKEVIQFADKNGYKIACLKDKLPTNVYEEVN